MRIISLIAVPLISFLLSCTHLSTPQEAFPSKMARLIVYLHSTARTHPPDITFTIAGIDVKKGEDEGWIKIVDGPVTVNSIDLASRQILLGEAGVNPGVYRAFRIRIARAEIVGTTGRASLALPEPDGAVFIDTSLVLSGHESVVISFEWDPEGSIGKGYRFQPVIKAEPQVPSARGLLLFISNSGSDYISIIDRSLERVSGAVTVGMNPLGMVLNSTQDILYVVNSGSRSISIVDTTQFYVQDTIPLTAGLGPSDIAFMPDVPGSIEGKLYIVNRISNDVTVVSTASKRILKTIQVGTSPSHIGVDIIRKEVYVTNRLSNDLSIISATSDSVVATIPVDRNPTGIIVGDDKLYVLNEGSSKISIISPSLRKVTSTISIVDPPVRGMYGFSNRLFVLSTRNSSVTFMNTLGVVTRTIQVGGKPIGIAGDEKRNRLYITDQADNRVMLVDPIGEKIVKELYVGKGPYGAVLLDR